MDLSEQESDSSDEETCPLKVSMNQSNSVQINQPLSGTCKLRVPGLLLEEEK